MCVWTVRLVGVCSAHLSRYAHNAIPQQGGNSTSLTSYANVHHTTGKYNPNASNVQSDVPSALSAMYVINVIVPNTLYYRTVVVCVRAGTTWMSRTKCV